MFKKIGHRVVCFDAASEGAGGAGDGTGANPVAAPWAASDGMWNLGEGETAKPWHSFVPEESARQTLEAKGYKNPAEVALAYHNLTKLQRGDPSVVGVPGEGATPDDWNAFYAKLGRPEAPDGYEFKFAPEVQVDETMEAFAKNAFHKAGLTPTQAQAVADAWNQFTAEQSTGATTKVAEVNAQELTALTTKWGADLEKNKAAGQRVVQALGLDASLIERVEGQIGSAAIVELLATIGRKSDEGGFTAGNTGGDPSDPSSMSKDQASKEIARLQGDAEFQKKYSDRSHPEHKAALERMEKLFMRV